MYQDGRVHCWWGLGPDVLEFLPPPPYRAVVPHGRRICALTRDGELTCLHASRPEARLAPEGRFRDVALRGGGTCAVGEDGSLRCWDRYGVLEDERSGSFAEVTSGARHTCALTRRGKAVCWGNDDWGQVSGRDVHLTPDQVRSRGGWAGATDLERDLEAVASGVPADGFVQVAAGQDHSCALRADGEVVCWGRNAYGESSPPPGPFLQVVAGADRSAGLRPDGSVTCWGRLDETRPGPYLSLSARRDRICGVLIDGSIDCWSGKFESGLDGLGPFVDVAVAARATCGLRGDGIARCARPDGSDFWIRDHAEVVQISPHGEGLIVAPHAFLLRGDGSVVAPIGGYRPLAPDGPLQWVSTGDHHACALRRDGTPVCWGSDEDGRASPPEDVFAGLDCGPEHCCALTSDGLVRCWGTDGFGRATPLDGAFTGEQRDEWRKEMVRSLRRAELWFARDDSLLRDEDPFPAVEGAERGEIAIEGTIAADARYEDLTFEISTAQLPRIDWRIDRTPTLPRGEDAVPFRCTWTADNASPTYEYGCRLEFPAGAVEFRDEYRWGDRDQPAPWADESEEAAGSATVAVSCSDTLGLSTPPPGPFSQVHAGGFFSTCGLRGDGTVVRWYECYRPMDWTPPGIYTRVVEQSGCGCGVRPDGTTVCWDPRVQMTDAFPRGNVVQNADGDGLSCSLRGDGVLLCWTGRDARRAAVWATGIARIAASGDVACGVDAQGGLTCWDADGSALETPGASVADLSGGERGFCVRTTEGALDCWDFDGTGADRPAEGMDSPPEGRFTHLGHSERSHFCAVRDDGAVLCWGCDLGDDGGASPYCESRCTPPEGRFVQVSTGLHHSCGVLEDGGVRCWGYRGMQSLYPDGPVLDAPIDGRGEACPAVVSAP